MRIRAPIARREPASGVFQVSIQDPDHQSTPAQQARIRDAIGYLNATLGPNGTQLVVLDDDAIGNADIQILFSDDSPCGTAADGVLGCASNGVITLLDSESWHSENPTTVPAHQYDFQTIVTHDLGHALGVERSSDPASVMFASLTPGTARRFFSLDDLDRLNATSDDHDSGVHVLQVVNPSISLKSISFGFTILDGRELDRSGRHSIAEVQSHRPARPQSRQSSVEVIGDFDGDEPNSDIADHRHEFSREKDTDADLLEDVRAFKDHDAALLGLLHEWDG